MQDGCDSSRVVLSSHIHTFVRLRNIRLTGNTVKANEPISPYWIRQVRAITPKIYIWQYPTPLYEIDARIDFTAEDDYLIHIRQTYRDSHISDVELYDSALLLLRRCHDHLSGPRSKHLIEPTRCDLDK